MSGKEFMELPIKVQGVIYAEENKKRDYLIIKRCEKDGGFWQGVTGTVEEGELLVGCLIREIKEELGIKKEDITKISQILQTIQWKKQNGFVITEYVYAVQISRKQKIELSDEHVEYKWCDFDEAYDTLGKENNKNTLKLVDMNEKLRK